MKRETITNGGTKQQSRHFIRTINGERGLVFSIVASATKQSRPVVVGQETIRRLMGYNTREIMHNERARVARVAQSRTKRLRFSLRCRDISCANYVAGLDPLSSSPGGGSNAESTEVALDEHRADNSRLVLRAFLSASSICYLFCRRLVLRCAFTLSRRANT